jgi:hypothetical protein
MKGSVCLSAQKGQLTYHIAFTGAILAKWVVMSRCMLGPTRVPAVLTMVPLLPIHHISCRSVVYISSRRKDAELATAYN